MGILDDAIREHLDLKRRHGAREAELREIEDEAFGAGEQPDPFAASGVYTEVEVGSAEAVDAGSEEPTRLVEPNALQSTELELEPEAAPLGEPTSEPEALRPTEPPPEPETSDQFVDLEPPSPIPGQGELSGQEEIPGQERLDAEPEAPAPSESLEELIAEEEPFPEDAQAPVPPAEEPGFATQGERDSESRPLEPEPDVPEPEVPKLPEPPEPESAVPDPPPPPPVPGSEPPGRARGRVDVPTQEHPPPGETGDLSPLPGDEGELGRPDTTYEPPPLDEAPSDEELPPYEEPSDGVAMPGEEPSPGSDGPQLYDFETDEDPIPSSSERSAIDDDFEALGPAEEEVPYLDEEEPYPEEPVSGVDSERGGAYEEEGTAVRPPSEEEEPSEGDSFETEERFREEDEGEEGLWFEKGPPKDFDFDD